MEFSCKPAFNYNFNYKSCISANVLQCNIKICFSDLSACVCLRACALVVCTPINHAYYYLRTNL